MTMQIATRLLVIYYIIRLPNMITTVSVVKTMVTMVKADIIATMINTVTSGAFIIIAMVNVVAMVAMVAMVVQVTYARCSNRCTCTLILT